jgi:2-methylcitrate dehydratase PrpD
MNAPAVRERTGAELLAAYAHGLHPANVPEDVRRQYRRLLLDTLGAGIYGTRGAAASLLWEEARSDGPPDERSKTAVVWGRAASVPAAKAALINATQAHEFELDDYVPPAKLHPGAVVIPAALAVADADTSGEQLMTAVIAGYEAMVRVSLAADSAATRLRGWHMTGLAGPFGAAVAAGLLLGLDQGQLASALGIAGSCSSGIFAFAQEGSMTKCFHAGRAAESGVQAAKLAARGFAGPVGVLDAADGGLLGAVSDAADPHRLGNGLGADFAMRDAAIKPHSCCGSVHSSIDAVLEIRSETGLDPTEIESVQVFNSKHVLRQCGFSYTGTGGPLEARMSLQYCCAVALSDGAAGLAQFTPERIADPGLQSLAQRVSVSVDDAIDAVYPFKYSSRVAVRARSGQTYEKYVDEPKGTRLNPVATADVKRKFHGLISLSGVAVDPDAVVNAVDDALSPDFVARLRHALE